MKNISRIALLAVLPLLAGCPQQEQITGRVIDLRGPVPFAPVLGMVWIEDTDQAKPAPNLEGLNSKESTYAYEADVSGRGLPAAYARAVTDEKGWFKLDKLNFSAETQKAVKAMKNPKVSRITVAAFQRGYLKGAVTAFPKKKAALADAVIILFKPANWKELSDDNAFATFKKPEFYNGYSKEFGATEEEKNWFLEYTHSNLWKAYTESDIKGNKELEDMCGRDYSDVIVAPAGMQRNPEHERCAELLRHMGWIRKNEEDWGRHFYAGNAWLETVKELAKKALAALPAEYNEPKAYEEAITAGINDAYYATNKVQNEQSGLIAAKQFPKVNLTEAQMLYNRGDKAGAYKSIGETIYRVFSAAAPDEGAKGRIIEEAIKLKTDVVVSPINTGVSLTEIENSLAIAGRTGSIGGFLTGISQGLAGFHIIVNRPQTAAAPGGDDGNHKDKPDVEKSTETPLAKLDRELKQTKSTTTAMALIENIADTVPQTEADVVLLGQLMDKYPVQGQKAITNIKDPKLAKAVMKECEKQAAKIKAVRTKGASNLTATDRQDYLNSYMNSAALIGALGNLKDKSAIPLLRGYLQDEDLSRVASVTLGRLGDTESLENMLGDIEKRKDIDLSGYGDKGLVRVVEELNKPGLEPKRKFALINQIKGSSSPERKRMLTDLALNHKDIGVRDRSAQALLNSIIVNPDSSDKAFISEWVNRTKNDETGYWAITSIRVSHGNGDKPLDATLIKLLVDILKNSTYSPTRSEAAYSLGIFKIKEAVPYLEDALMDKDGAVRGGALGALRKVLGGDYKPKHIHPDDAKVRKRIIYVKPRAK